MSDNIPVPKGMEAPKKVGKKNDEFEVVEKDDIEKRVAVHESGKKTTNKNEVDLAIVALTKVMTEALEKSKGNSRTRRGNNNGNIHKVNTKINTTKRLTGRNANMEDKLKATTALEACYKVEQDKIKMVLCIAAYGKRFNLDLMKNSTIITNAITKAEENDYKPDQFLDLFRSFLDDYKYFIQPFQAKCVAKGANENFLSWGVMAEPLKGEFENALLASLRVWEEDHSFRFLYSKFAFYGGSLDQAIHVTRKLIIATLKTVKHAQDAGVKIDFSKDISNEDCKKILSGHKLIVGTDEMERAKTGVFSSEHWKAKIHGSVASALVAVGIPPHAHLQNSEYKQNYNKPDISSKAHKAVVENFGIIRETYNKYANAKITYTDKKFDKALKTCYDMWRPMFVWARCIRAAMFPQANFGVTSDIELMEDYGDLNADIDLEQYGL